MAVASDGQPLALGRRQDHGRDHHLLRVRAAPSCRFRKQQHAHQGTTLIIHYSNTTVGYLRMGYPKLNIKWVAQVPSKK